MRAAGVRVWVVCLVLAVAAALFACSGGGGSDEPSGNWDELVWDEGDWQ